MLSREILGGPDSAVLLASPDEALRTSLIRMLNALGLCVEVAADGAAAVAMMEASARGILLLDVRLPGVGSGCLLAEMEERGIHRRCAIGVIADQVSDELIARLREGVIDDIVPRNTDALGWSTHLHSMLRGHDLRCELETMRETTQLEVRHDRLTGLLTRETMLTMLFKETDRVQRLRGSLSLILLELDEMARRQQELGAAACDELRREAAARTEKILRSYDLLGRVGDDAFLLALPGCSTINAMMLAERLRMDLFGEPFRVATASGEALAIRLTACFAVTSSRGRSPVVVLREAESTLAQARLRGADTLRCASESPLSADCATGAATLFPASVREVDRELVTR